MKSAKRGFVKAAGKHLPEMRLARRYHGLIVLHKLAHRDSIQAWPRKRGKPKSAVTLEQNADFKRFVQGVKDTSDADKVGARLLAQGTTDTWRDVLSRAVTGSLIELDNPDIAMARTFLDQLGTITGSVIVCTDDGWVAMTPPDADAILAFDIDTHLPVWVDPPIDAITELTGDVLAGPGDGSQAATLSNTGVVPGVYDPARITVDAKGRITAASDSAISTGIDQLTGDVVAGPGSGSQAATLSNSGVAAGVYSRATVTIDAKGRVTLAASGVNDAAANQLTGDVTAGPGAGSQVATLAASGVAAGSYSGVDLTVDAKGRITAAANGAASASSPLNLAGTSTAANSASIEVAGLLGTHWKLIGSLLRPATTATASWLRFGTGAGPAYATTGYYTGGRANGVTTVFAFDIQFSNDVAFKMYDQISSTNPGYSFEADVFTDNATFVEIIGRVIFLAGDGNQYMSNFGGKAAIAAQLTGFRLLQSAGNLTSGSLSVYRVYQ